MSLWTIKQVTRMTGATESALRYYEEKGVIMPTVRKETGRRHWLYDDKAVENLKSLLLLKHIGVPIMEIKMVFSDEEEGRRIVKRRLEELRKERRELETKILIAQIMAVSAGENFMEGKGRAEDDLKMEIINETIRKYINHLKYEKKESVCCKMQKGGVYGGCRQFWKQLQCGK